MSTSRRALPTGSELRAGDGRRLRATRTRLAIIAALRDCLRDGHWRPTRRDMHARLELDWPAARRTVDLHCRGWPALLRAALDGQEDTIIEQVIGDRAGDLAREDRVRLAEAIVLGTGARPRPEPVPVVIPWRR